MKFLYKIFFVTLILLAAGLTSNATVWIVDVQNYEFVNSPASVTVGDTIRWEWVNGTHTTTSTSVPAGAMTWNAFMNSGMTTYEYVVTVTGSYSYECVFHSSTMSEDFIAYADSMYVTLTVTDDITCVPGCPADISTSVTNGIPPYTYNWSNGGTDATQTDVCEGIYSVTVVDAMGEAASQSVWVIVVEMCFPPQAVNITDITSSGALASWSFSGCAEKYRVRLKNMSTGVTNLYLVNAPETTKLFNNLSPNTMYQVKVRVQCTINGATLSPWHSPVYFTTEPGTVTSCVTPANVTASGTPNYSANVSWTPVEDANGYRLRYREQGTTAWTPVVINNGLASSYVIMGLSPTTIYEYQIRTKCTVNPITWSTFSAIQTFETPARLGEDESDATTISVYPNPSNGLVNINATEAGRIILYDAVGKEVLNQEINTQAVSTFTDLPNGMLSYQFINREGSIRRGTFVVIR